MNKVLTLAGIFLVFLVVACSSTTQKKSDIPTHYRNLTFQELEYQAPLGSEYRSVLSNGIPVYLYPQKDLPLITVNFTFKENNYPDAIKNSATLQLLSSMYRKGGTQTISADSIDELLEFKSAGVSGGLSNYQSSIQVDVLSKDVYEILTVAKELFLKPGFDETRLVQLKEHYVQNIAHQYDHPSALSQALYAHVMYGEHPINWSFDSADVVGVTREQLITAQAGRLNSKNLVLGIAGDFNREEMIQFLEEYFKDWHVFDSVEVQHPAPQVVSQSGIYIVDKEVAQAHIRMGQPFVKRPHEDYYATVIASYILGSGGFTSRLVSRIRTDEGLAYTVRSFVGSSYDYQPTIGVGLQTKVESAPYAVSLCLEEINRLIREGVSDDELKRAQDYYIQSIPSIFDTPENSVNFFVMSEINNRSPDHMTQYVEKLKAVTKEDVQRVAKLYFSPEKMAITIVGPQGDLLAKDKAHGVSLADIAPITVLKTEELLMH